ncbi:MAG TPA: hypothetical protein PK467_11810, partial [Candidatus Wallbacteria bacterium]|nr:hypothetical protein [Candidatus Wallbacteria bacterium]
MSKRPTVLFLTLIIILSFGCRDAFAQISFSKPSAPPAGHQPMPMPANESFMGYAIESSNNFELSTIVVILDPSAVPANGPFRTPEGMLFIGPQRLILTNLKIEKSDNANYDPSKPEGIVPKVKSFKAKIISDVAEAASMPKIPSKSAEKESESASSKNEVDAKIITKFIDGGRKICVLSGTANYNGKKYELYFNFLPPLPPGYQGPQMQAPQPVK